MRGEEMQGVLSTLSHRERKVIELRYGLAGDEPMTLEEVGRYFGVTRERDPPDRERAPSMKLKSYARRRALQRLIRKPAPGILRSAVPR